jgi:hypothetical protein
MRISNLFQRLFAQLDIHDEDSGFAKEGGRVARAES